MVDGVLHNAFLRMEAPGDGLDDVIRATGRRRWFGRGGLAVGGAASLAVGAVLGGVLEGVPILLPPPAGAAASPQVVHPDSSDSSPLKLTGLDGLSSAARSAVGALSAATTQGIGQGVLPQTGAPAGGVYTPPVGGAPAATSGSVLLSGAGNSGPVKLIGSQAPVGDPAPSIPPALSANPGGQALNTVTQVASQLPVVGSTVAGVVGTVSGVVAGVTSTVSSAGAAGSSSSPLSGVTSTVNGAVNCVTGLLSGSSKGCPASSVTSAIGLP